MSASGYLALQPRSADSAIGSPRESSREQLVPRQIAQIGEAVICVPGLVGSPELG
jgi:hypothetical protein